MIGVQGLTIPALERALGEASLLGSHVDDRLILLVSVLVMSVIGCLAYVLAARLLRAPEVIDAWLLIRRRLVRS